MAMKKYYVSYVYIMPTIFGKPQRILFGNKLYDCEKLTSFVVQDIHKTIGKIVSFSQYTILNIIPLED